MPAPRDGPPSTLHPHAAARPWATALSLLAPLAWVAGAALGVLALGALALHLLLQREAGARWLLGQVPGLQVQGWQGALGGERWQAERLRYSWDQGRSVLVIESLDASGLRWRWRPHTEAWLGLDIGQLDAARVTLTTASAAASTAATPLPAHIALPLPVQLAQARIGQFVLNGLAPAERVAVQGLSLDARARGEHSLKTLDADVAGVRFTVSGRVGTAAPLAMAWQARAEPAPQSGLPPWTASATLEGDARQSLLTAELQGVASAGRPAPTATLAAEIQPLQAWPVAMLTLRTRELDLAALHARAPHTLLSGQAALRMSARRAPALLRIDLVNGLPGRLDAQRLPVAQLSAELVGSLAQPDRLELRQAQLLLATAEAQAGRVQLSGLWQDDNLALSTRIERLAPARFDDRAPPMTLSGPLELRLSGLPRPSTLLGSANATPRPAPAAASASAASAAASSAGPSLASAPASAATPAASPEPTRPSLHFSLDLAGELDGAQLPVRLAMEGQADAQRLLLPKLRAQAGRAQADLQLSLQHEGGAAAEPWRLVTRGSVDRFDPLPWWPGSAGSAWRRGPHRLSGQWEFDGRLPGRAAQLSPPELLQALSGTGRASLSDSLLAGVPLSGQLSLSQAQLTPSPRGTATRTALRGELRAAGNVLRLEGLTTEVADSRGAALNPAGVSQAAAKQNSPTATPATAPSPRPTARSQPASAAPAEANRWTAELQAPALPALAPLFALHPQAAVWAPQQGSLSATASAEGRWPALRTEGRAQASQLQAGGLGLAHGTLQWRLDTHGERRLDAQAELAGLRQGERSADHLRAKVEGTLAAHRIDIGAAAPVSPPPLWLRVLGVNGQTGTRAQLVAQGTWRDLPGGGGSWQARIDRLLLGAWDGSEADSAPASLWAQARDLQATLVLGPDLSLRSLRAEPGRVQISDVLALRWDAAELRAGPGRTDGQLVADIEPFRLAPLLRRLQPGTPWEGDLQLAARLRIQAGERFAGELMAERRSGDLQIAADDGLLQLGLSELRLGLVAQDGLWTLTPSLRGASLGELSGKASARARPEDRRPPDSAALSGHLLVRVADLGIWSAWLPPGWRLGGELRTQADLAGTLGQPQLQGDLRGRNIAVRNRLQGVNLHDGQLIVKLDGERARIDWLTLKGGEGQLSLTGEAQLGAQPQARLALQAEKFRLVSRVDRMAVASGQANLVLRPDGGQLEGRLRLDEGLYDLSARDAPSLDDDVTVQQEEAEASLGREQAQGLKREFRLGLELDLGERLQVRGRGLDTQLRGQLRLSSPGGRLAVNGAIRTESGTYAAWGQKLDLERGVFSFTGPPEEPRLDILALRPNLDVRVGVAITGSAVAPRLRLFSDPELPETEKLSWLLLGRAPDNLGRSDTALLQRAAVSVMAGEGEPITDQMLKRLGIDDLSLRQGDTDVRETVVTLGKQLSRRWYLGYERGLNATAGTWQLVYRIAQRFTLRAQSGLENSLDIIWTWRVQEPPPEAAVQKTTIRPRPAP